MSDAVGQTAASKHVKPMSIKGFWAATEDLTEENSNFWRGLYSAKSLLPRILVIATIVGLCGTSLLAQSEQPLSSGPPLITKCESAPLMAAFSIFGETGVMPRNLSRFLSDAALQKIEPYMAFDNVYYVGICWVSAWLITSPNGHILIDSLYEPFTDQLIANIRAVGFDPNDIKLVAVTHGHFDHAGGMAKLKATLAPQTRFAMSKEGWREAQEFAAQSQASGRNTWIAIDQDVVIEDGVTLSAAGMTIRPYETPGHTMGTISIAFDAQDGAKTYRAFTIGGLGLNAIKGPEQVKAFIASVKKIRALIDDAKNPLDLHLTTHPFSTGLTEAKERIKSRKAGDPHPLIDIIGFRTQLDSLQAGAEKRLLAEQQKIPK